MRITSNRILALLVSAGIAFSQYVAVEAEKEPEPGKPPQTTPEPRRKLTADPDTLFPLLLSKDANNRRRALEALDLSWMPDEVPSQVTNLATNLDSADDLERLIIVEGSSRSAGVILKNESGGWWEIGSFGCCWPGKLQAPHIELKQTVWSGTNDLLVRTSGAHGTGVGKDWLRIYRVWNGRLYKVMEVLESAYNLAGEERSRLIFPDFDSSPKARVITVQRTIESKGSRRQTCTRYVWDANRFLFSPQPPRPGLCKQ